MENPGVNQGLFSGQLPNEAAQNKTETKKQKAQPQPSSGNVGELLDQLLKKGQCYDIVHVFGLDWEIKLLNQDELLACQKASSLNGMAESFVVRLNSTKAELLALAIQKINGESLDIRFGKKIDRTEYDTEAAYKEAIIMEFRKFLGQLAPASVEILFEKYLEIDRRRDSEIEELKKK